MYIHVVTAILQQALTSEEWDLLLKIHDLLMCKDTEVVVSTVTDMLTDHLTLR